MTANKEIIYNEAVSPLMTTQENIDFRRWQLYIYRTIYDIMEQGFSYENFVAKIRAFVNFINAKTNGYYICTMNETASFISLEFYTPRHSISRAHYEIKYDS